MAIPTIQESHYVCKTKPLPTTYGKGRRHGNFKVGVKKETNVIDMVEIKDPDQVDSVILNFIASGERIVVVKTPENTPVCRYRNVFSSRLLKRSKLSPMFRRVIVREYDGVLYLARRAFWSGSKLPFEYSDQLSYESEIGFKVRQQNENQRTIYKTTEHMSELTDEQLKEIADWEATEKVNELLQEAAKVVEVTFGK